MFHRYTSEEVTDLAHFVKAYVDSGFEEMMIEEIRVFDLDGDAGNSWMRIQFDNGSWLEEILLEEDWGEYYVNGDPVEEDIFLQQVAIYETEEYVIGYQPKRWENKMTKKHPPS